MARAPPVWIPYGSGCGRASRPAHLARAGIMKGESPPRSATFTHGPASRPSRHSRFMRRSFSTAFARSWPHHVVLLALVALAVLLAVVLPLETVRVLRQHRAQSRLE